MSIYDLMAIIITLTAFFAYLNARYIKMPTTIAIMSGSLIMSLVLVVVGEMGYAALEERITVNLVNLDFHTLLMQGMLSFLLFAGSLNIDFYSLRKFKWEIGTLATLTTVLSMILVGLSSYYLLPFLSIHLPIIYCLLFGALISPTDPIAVLAIFKRVGASDSLNITVSGESLFNDGVGIVMFITLYHLAVTGETATWQHVSFLFMQQTGGGIVYGIILGMLGYHLISSINNYKVEVLITLAMATGGYALANAIGISGPLAMVTSGIFLGNRGRRPSKARPLRENLDNFWELIDEILNAILFLIVGFELIVIRHSHWDFWAAILAIPMVLIIRFMTVSLPFVFFKRKKVYPSKFVTILAWGGLRGGLAVALALSLPPSQYRDIILTMTYAVVVFAVLVQGSTIKSLLLKNA